MRLECSPSFCYLSGLWIRRFEVIRVMREAKVVVSETEYIVSVSHCHVSILELRALTVCVFIHCQLLFTVRHIRPSVVIANDE